MDVRREWWSLSHADRELFEHTGYCLRRLKLLRDAAQQYAKLAETATPAQRYAALLDVQTQQQLVEQCLLAFCVWSTHYPALAMTSAIRERFLSDATQLVELLNLDVLPPLSNAARTYDELVTLARLSSAVQTMREHAA